MTIVPFPILDFSFESHTCTTCSALDLEIHVHAVPLTLRSEEVLCISAVWCFLDDGGPGVAMQIILEDGQLHHILSTSQDLPFAHNSLDSTSQQLVVLCGPHVLDGLI